MFYFFIAILDIMLSPKKEPIEESFNIESTTDETEPEYNIEPIPKLIKNNSENSVITRYSFDRNFNRKFETIEEAEEEHEQSFLSEGLNTEITIDLGNHKKQDNHSTKSLILDNINNEEIQTTYLNNLDSIA